MALALEDIDSSRPRRLAQAVEQTMHGTMTFAGTTAEIVQLIRLVAGQFPITIHLGNETPTRLEGLEALPPEARPTPIEQALIQLDLRGEPRRRIAPRLGLTVGTVTVYRRNIRLKFRHVPPEQRPGWMTRWFHRFPGRDQQKPPAPGQTPPRKRRRG
ncbi:MAG: hypothetical protein OHK0022_50150 [Roseiflexaceae bacterium]